jgi:1,4-alpha-glucan branching enzyme
VKKDVELARNEQGVLRNCGCRTAGPPEYLILNAFGQPEVRPVKAHRQEHAVPSITQDHGTADTPLGANLVGGGATFRAWAPKATEVHLKLNASVAAFQPGPTTLLKKDPATGVWGGFVAGAKDGDTYRFFVVGEKGKGLKRAPYARELTLDPAWPDCDCIIRDPGSFPWHDGGYQRPDFSDLVIYQLHVGTFYATDKDGADSRKTRGGTFLDVLFRLDHLLDLGVNAIQPLPIIEFGSDVSMGYNGADLFSPEMRYAVTGADLDRYLTRVNDLLRAKGLPELTRPHLEGQVNQLKALVDVCHVYGVAVLLDVVYNHAGGGVEGGVEGFDAQSLYFFDLQDTHSRSDHLYFSDDRESGGLIFDFGHAEVRKFLTDNARFFYREFHVDGFRFDQVTIIDGHGGWGFCQGMTTRLRSDHAGRAQIAEFWREDPSWAFRPTSQNGAGFDAVWSDKLRDSVRNAVKATATAFGGAVDLGKVAESLWPRFGPENWWRVVNCVENHDRAYADHPDEGGRLAQMADGADARSWYATSRARVATGLLLTAPGIPMLFMGQELLDYRPWSDNLEKHPDAFVHWDEVGKVKDVGDFLLFTQELVALRKRLKGLRRGNSRSYHAPAGNRVVAFHRWVEFEGHDVVVVASLKEATYEGYHLGFPRPGAWREVFNSDYYENHPNPQRRGN